MSREEWVNLSEGGKEDGVGSYPCQRKWVGVGEARTGRLTGVVPGGGDGLAGTISWTLSALGWDGYELHL